MTFLVFFLIDIEYKYPGLCRVTLGDHEWQVPTEGSRFEVAGSQVAASRLGVAGSHEPLRGSGVAGSQPLRGSGVAGSQPLRGSGVAGSQPLRGIGVAGVAAASRLRGRRVAEAACDPATLGT